MHSWGFALRECISSRSIRISHLLPKAMCALCYNNSMLNKGNNSSTTAIEVAHSASCGPNIYIKLSESSKSGRDSPNTKARIWG